jgi:hypothetical protein
MDEKYLCKLEENRRDEEIKWSDKDQNLQSQGIVNLENTHSCPGPQSPESPPCRLAYLGLASAMILNVCETNALFFSGSSPRVRVDRMTENRKTEAKETGYMGRQLQALGNKHWIDSGKTGSTLWLVFHIFCYSVSFPLSLSL